MTIIAGFIPPRGDSVVLWADSAINHGLGIRNARSSLGEMSEGNGSRTTEEGVIKLVRLTSHAAATWASNDAEQGHAFIRWMQPHMTSSRPLRDLLREGADAANVTEPTTCLFARCVERPELCAVTFPERHIQEAAILVGGSPPEELKLSVLAAIEQGIWIGCSNEQIIAALQAVFLMRSSQSSPFQDGVGGATFGLAITRDGLKWGDDVGWIVLPREVGQQPSHGILYIRDGVGIVWSTLIGNAGRAFVQYRTAEEKSKFEAAVAEVISSANELSSKHIIVTMLLSGVATVVSPQCTPTIVEFGRDQIVVHPDLVAQLLATPDSGPLSVFPCPPTRHRGIDLIDRGVASVADARILAEYIRLERKYGSLGERYTEIRVSLLKQFPDDEWLREQLADDEPSLDAGRAG